MVLRMVHDLVTYPGDAEQDGPGQGPEAVPEAAQGDGAAGGLHQRDQRRAVQTPVPAIPERG